MRKVLMLLVCFASAHIIFAQNSLFPDRDERSFIQGQKLMAQKEYGAARASFQEFLANYSNIDLKRGEAEYYRAVCALLLFHQDGEKLIEDFIVEHPHHPKSIVAYFDLANFYYQEKNYSKASQYYSKVDFRSLSNDQQILGRFHWGYSLFNQKKLKEALEQFNYYKVAGGQYGPASSYYAGFIEFGNADYENALIDFRRAGQSPSYEMIVPVMIASVHYKKKEYDLLIDYVNGITNKDDIANKEELSLLKAEAYFKKSDYNKALIGYQEYLEGRERYADNGVLFRAGYTSFQTKNIDNALGYLKSAASTKDSIGYYASYYVGVIYLQQNQKLLALTAFDLVRNFKSNPKLVEESIFQFAKISYDLGMADQSIKEFERFLIDYSDSPYTTEVKELLSQAYVNANNYNRAIEYIEAMQKRNPAIDRAYQKATFLKGTELFNQENYVEAVKYFDKSLNFPEDQNYLAEAAFWNGETYSIGRKYDQAIGYYQQVIGLPNFTNQEIISKTRYGLGYAYFNLKQYDRALFNFKEFVNKSSRNPNVADGTLRLADCYYVTKSYSDALANYRKSVQLKTTDEDYARLQTGVIYGIERKYAEAINELDLVIRNFPQSRIIDEAMFQRGQMDFEQGKYAEAVTGYSRLISRVNSSPFLPYAHIRRAASYYNLKEYSKTADDYAFVIKKYPTHPIAKEIILPLQESLNLAGRTSEFDQYFTQFKTSNPDSKGVEGIEFETAKSLHFNQDYNRAIVSLTNYVTNYPESGRLPEAKYYLAESYYRIKKFEEAKPIYYELSGDQSFAQLSRVIGRLSEIEFRSGQYQAAIPQFQRLSLLAATKKDQYNAWSGLMESYYFLAKYDSVDRYANMILEKGNVNAGAQNKASLFIGKAAMAKGDYERAKDEFLNTLNSARDENGAEAKYLLGEILFLTKQHKQCFEVLVSLNADFSAYPNWVGKGYLLLADNAMETGDVFQAKATLNSLIEHFPEEHIRNLAKEKLQKIEADELKMNKAVKSDSIEN